MKDLARTARWLRLAGYAVLSVTSAAVARLADVHYLWLALVAASGVIAAELWSHADALRSQPYRWRCDDCGTGVAAADPGVVAQFAEAHPAYCAPPR